MVATHQHPDRHARHERDDDADDEGVGGLPDEGEQLLLRDELHEVGGDPGRLRVEARSRGPGELPGDEPIAWREVAKKALGQARYLFRILALIMLPVIWRGGRRVDSWTPGRKLRFTLTALIFTAFSLDLAYWGALTPWSG